MKRFFEKPFVSENELEFEQLRIEDELLRPRRPQKLSAERTVSELMRSEYALSNAESGSVATKQTDMKEITLNDYYTKLTKSQKKKHAEKKGMICYYEWYDTLVEECTPEEVGYIFLALIYYDIYGGSKELPAFLAEKINSDRALKLTFLIFMDKIAAASKEWIVSLIFRGGQST